MGLGTQGCMSETRTLLTINQLVHFKRGDEVIFFLCVWTRGSPGFAVL